MKDQVWIAAVTAMLLLAGCTTNRVGVVNIYNPPAAHPAARPALNAVMAHRVRALRVAEEAALIKTSGAPQPLPTGICSAVVPVTADGMIDGALQIGCSTSSLSETMRQAILAQAPYDVPAGQKTLRISVYMNDPEPGVKHG